MANLERVPDVIFPHMFAGELFESRIDVQADAFRKTAMLPAERKTYIIRVTKITLAILLAQQSREIFWRTPIDAVP